MKQPFAGGQGVRSPARRLVLLERPARRGDVQHFEMRVRRPGCLQRQVIAVRHQQDRIGIKQTCDFRRERLSKLQPLADRCKELREPGQHTVLRRAALGEDGLFTNARSELAGDDRNAQQNQHGDDVLRVLDRESARRRDEEEVIG